MSQRDVVIAGRYRLLEQIAVGGMGTVWQARDERLQRTVAAKLLRLPPGASDAEAEVAKNRAMREARITAKLHHPHAVPVFDVVEHDGRPCLIMQYLPSRTLAEVLKENRFLPADEVALVGAEVGSALAAAHAAGIVHRDVKPANILVAADGSAKITDFGISHVLGDARLTSTGMLTGTPAYLAPEVARGEPSSPASDVFSLGATLYAAVEGSPPFGTDDNPIALLHRVASEPVTPPARAGALAPVLLAMLSVDPGGRPSMAEAAEALQRLDVNERSDATPTAVLVPPATQPIEPGSPSPPTRALPPVAATGAAATTEAAEAGDAHRAGAPPTVPPAAPDGPRKGPDPSDRSRRGLAVVAALLGLALVAFLAFRTLTGDDDPSQAGAPPASATSAASPTRSATSEATTTTEATTSRAPTTTPPATTPSPTTPDEPAPPERVQLAQALRSYYGLLPDDTDEGYSLLTEGYRSTTAGSLETYEDFWDAIDKVVVRDIAESGPQRVEATLTYTFEDGRVVEERTAYGFVEEDGVLKIDSSEVLSSREL